MFFRLLWLEIDGTCLDCCFCFHLPGPSIFPNGHVWVQRFHPAPPPPPPPPPPRDPPVLAEAGLVAPHSAGPHGPSDAAPLAKKDGAAADDGGLVHGLPGYSCPAHGKHVLSAMVGFWQHQSPTCYFRCPLKLGIFFTKKNIK